MTDKLISILHSALFGCSNRNANLDPSNDVVLEKTGNKIWYQNVFVNTISEDIARFRLFRITRPAFFMRQCCTLLVQCSNVLDTEPIVFYSRHSYPMAAQRLTLSEVA